MMILINTAVIALLAVWGFAKAKDLSKKQQPIKQKSRLIPFLVVWLLLLALAFSWQTFQQQKVIKLGDLIAGIATPVEEWGFRLDDQIHQSTDAKAFDNVVKKLNDYEIKSTNSQVSEDQIGAPQLEIFTRKKKDKTATLFYITDKEVRLLSFHNNKIQRYEFVNDSFPIDILFNE